MLLLNAVALGACTPSASSPHEVSQPQDDPWVTVAIAAEVAPPGQRVHGIVVPPASARLAFEVDGRLVLRAVRAGAGVTAGQALGALDPAPYRHALAAARAELRRLEAQRDQARRDAARARTLGARGALNTAAGEAAGAGLAALEAAVAAARAGRAEAERRLARTTLRAPHGGRVVATHADPGALLAAGQPLLTLHAEGAPEVALELTAAQAAALVVGGSATVQAHRQGHRPGQGPALPATVVELADAAGPAQLTVARLRLAPDAPVRVGEAVLAQLPAPATPELRVPLRALADPSGDGPWVLRVQAGQVARIPVVVGALHGDAVTLIAGLAPGDPVVTSHPLSLRPGQAVRVRP